MYNCIMQKGICIAYAFCMVFLFCAFIQQILDLLFPELLCERE